MADPRDPHGALDPHYRTVYLNGRYVPESEAKVSIYDLGVTQAAAAFEMTRSFKQCDFKLNEHLVRLANSMTALGLPSPFADFHGEMTDICGHVEYRNMGSFPLGEEYRLMIVISAGLPDMYAEMGPRGPCVYVAVFPLRFTTAGMGRQFATGGRAMIAKTRQVPDTCVPSWSKHRSRLHFWLAQEEAKEAGVDWAILLNRQGEVTECPGANVFVVRDGVLFTPDADCLPGISRQYVIDLADQLGIPCQETAIPEAWLFQAEEVFVTGTPFCLLPITWLNGIPIGQIGPIYQAILAEWSMRVRTDIMRQIQDWDAKCLSAV